MRSIIFHHNDRDGIVSAAIMILWLKTKSGVINDAIKSVDVDYRVPLSEKVDDIDQYDRIILVDYSISTPENAKWILDLIDQGKDVIWIDHHLSSIKMYEEYPMLKNLIGYRVNGMAGCGLCWIWYETGGNISPDVLKPYLDGEMSKDTAIDILTSCKAPQTVLYSHKYDIWDTNSAVIDFTRGFNPTTPIDPELYSAIQYPKYDKIVMERAFREGKIISKAINQYNQSVADGIGFELDVIDNLGEVPVIYKAFAMDRPFANSLAFGDRVKQYDILIPFYYNGDGYTYSMYTTRDDINVATYCKAMGGGGHRQAAGFTSDKLVISRGSALTINNKSE